MHQYSTILQYLPFKPGITFDNPSTPDGKLWNSALKQVSQTPGWGELDWGPRVAANDVVDLLIKWQSNAALRDFMIHGYQQFLRTLSPLLYYDKDSKSGLPTPYLFNLHPGMPSLDLGAVSSLYELSFDMEPNDEFKITLGIEIQFCHSFFFDAVEEVDQDDLILGMDGNWIEPFQLASSPSPPPSSSDTLDPITETESKTETERKKYLVIIDWTSQDAANKISSYGRIEKPSLNGSPCTVGDYFASNILEKSSRWSRHDVVFENVSAANVDWLDKEEKWSTYVLERMKALGTRIA